MKAATAPRSLAGRCRGTIQIVLYNWPFYVVGAFVSLLGLALALLAPWPAEVRWPLGIGAALAAFWLAGSLLASYWVYDHSALCRWDWVRELFPVAPKRWANIHVGLDETTLKLRGLFPGTESTVLDIYDPAEMTEPSIRRARRLTPAPVPATPADVTALPLGDAELDAVFLLFAAHEIRRPELRLRFFRELRRVLKPAGRVLIVEHLRDLPNFVAFGPGFFHFHPRREWLRVAGEAGFAVVRESRFTPFVGLFLLEVAR
jgi:ubiquinone/menaquinone biosynthesis C-methylase UbiE